MAAERALGFEPTDREFEKLGYDIESRLAGDGRLRFIEVKGRVTGADVRDQERDPHYASTSHCILPAIVEFLEGGNHHVHYVWEPFKREPDFGVTGISYEFFAESRASAA